MGRAAQREGSGSAGRVAARRRDTSRGRPDTPRRGVKPAKSPGAKRGKRGSLAARGFKLVVLMALMGVIGFFAVLVVDVTGSLMGKVHVPSAGGDTSFGMLWDKVVDRVLDRDVPRMPDAPTKPALKPLAPPRIARPQLAGPPARAELPAARPDEDARHVDTPARADPQVEQAQRRLDDLLQRL